MLSNFSLYPLVAMGVFFYLKEQKGDDGVSSLGWLPLTSLVVYIAFFSIGFGPVPWVIMGQSTTFVVVMKSLKSH